MELLVLQCLHSLHNKIIFNPTNTFKDHPMWAVLSFLLCRMKLVPLRLIYIVCYG